MQHVGVVYIKELCNFLMVDLFVRFVHCFSNGDSVLFIVLISDILTVDSVFWDVTLHYWVSGSQCFFRNVVNHSHSSAASYPRKTESSITAVKISELACLILLFRW